MIFHPLKITFIFLIFKFLKNFLKIFLCTENEIVFLWNFKEKYFKY